MISYDFGRGAAGLICLASAAHLLASPGGCLRAGG